MAYYDELTNFIRHDLKYLFLEPLRRERAEERADKKLKEREDKKLENKINELMITNLSNQVTDVSKNWDSQPADFDRVREAISSAEAKFKDNELLIQQLDLLNTNLGISSGRINRRNTSIDEIDARKQEIITGLEDENLSTDIEPLIDSLKASIDANSNNLGTKEEKAFLKQLKELEGHTKLYNKFRELDDSEIDGFQTAINNDQYKNTMQLGYDYYKAGLHTDAKREFTKGDRLLNTFKEDNRRVNSLKSDYFDEEGSLLPQWENQTYSYIDHRGQLVADMGIYDALIEVENYQKNNMPKDALNVLKRLPKRIGLSNTAVKKQKEVDVLNVGAAVNGVLDQITANRETLFSDTKFGNKEVQDIFDRLNEVGQTRWDRTSTLSNDNFKKNIDQALTELANLGEGARGLLGGWFDIDDDQLQTNLALWETAPKDPQEDINILTQSDIEKAIADDMETRKADLMQTGTGSTFDWQQESWDRESYDTGVIGRMLQMLELRKEIDKLNSLIVQ